MRERIAELILSRNGKAADRAMILSSSDLFRDGFLDSLACVSLVHALEKEFGVKIGPFWISRTHLGSVSAIEALVESRRA